MEYIVKQQNESLGRSYIVTNLDNELKYVVDCSFGKIPKVIEIKDLENEVVATITKQFLKFYARYSVKIGETDIVVDRNDIGPILSISINDSDWTLDGDFVNKKFTVTADSKSKISITRKIFKFYSEYNLYINNPNDLIFGLVIVMIINDLIYS